MDGIASFLAGTSDASHSSPRRLSQDPSEWAGEVIRLISGMIPPEVPAQPQVHFNQQDEINGYAVGSVHLADGNGDVKGFIPIIVKRFQLKPMDIIVSGGKFMPLTERRLRELFESTSMDDGTIDMWKVRDGSDRDLTETNPSSAGLYPYAGAPMSREDFLQTLTPEDQADLKAALGKEAQALGLLKALDKVASVHELMTPPAEPEPEPLVATVRTFSKVAAGKYRVMTSYDGNFGPKVVETDEGGLRVAIKEAIPENRDDWLTRVHTKGTATLKSKEEESEENLAKEENINQGPKGGEVFLYRADRTAPEDGTEHCGCFAMTTSGQRIRGVLLPKVVDLDGKSVDTKLFVGRSVAGVQPKIAVERISGTVDFKEAVEDAVPRQGETGTLVHVDENGDAVALVPMTIDSIWTDDGRHVICDEEEGVVSGPRMTINARTMLGKLVEVVLAQCKGIVEITPNYRLREGKKPKRRRYAVSSEFSWVPMSEFKEFMTQPRLMRDAEDLEKKANIPQLRVLKTDLGYAIQAPWVKVAQELIDKQAMGPGAMLPGQGTSANTAAVSSGVSPLPAPLAPPNAAPAAGGIGGVGKTASVDLGCLSEAEARHVLCEWGLNVPTADGVLKAASARGSLWVRGIENPIEKLARHPFLATPSKARALRAALMGLGIGGAGVAAGGVASSEVAGRETAPEQAALASQRMDIMHRQGEATRQKAVADQRVRRAERVTSSGLEMFGAGSSVVDGAVKNKEGLYHDGRNDPFDIVNKRERALHSLMGGLAASVGGAGAGAGKIGEFATGHLADRAGRRAAGMDEARAAAEEALGGHVKIQSANPALVKAASARGSLWVRGIENPIEKLARHPFLATPSKAKMLRAALAGLGLGGLGAAGLTGAGMQMASDEMLPEAEQSWNQSSRHVSERRGLEAQADAAQQAMAEAAGQRARGQRGLGTAMDSNKKTMSFNPFSGQGMREIPRMDVARRGLADLVQGGAGELAGKARSELAQSRLGQQTETYHSALGQRPFGDYFQKTQSANPAMEMIAFLRGQAKAAFPKLAYAATVHFGREKLAETEDTIESAMDLNFLNPQNVSYFIGLTPKIEDVLDGLGRLLVAVRIGLPDIDEEVVRSAAKQLDSILSGLRALSFAETDE